MPISFVGEVWMFSGMSHFSKNVYCFIGKFFFWGGGKSFTSNDLGGKITLISNDFESTWGLKRPDTM